MDLQNTSPLKDMVALRTPSPVFGARVYFHAKSTYDEGIYKAKDNLGYIHQSHLNNDGKPMLFLRGKGFPGTIHKDLKGKFGDFYFETDDDWVVLEHLEMIRDGQNQ